MKSIIVLGGGSAGWMAAAFLNRVLCHGDTGTPLEITVIESDEIGTVGVGEATIPTLRQFLRIIDIPEWEFLAETDATLKHGIRFLNWLAPTQNKPIPEYYHLFECPPVLEGFGLASHWLALRDRGLPQPEFWDAVGVQAELCRSMKSPKPFDAGPYDAPFPYAYHVDAAKFASLLRKVALDRGVKRVRDTVTQAHRTGAGLISHLTTRDHGELRADFYVDASGFGAFLIGQTLGEEFENWSDFLLCDRAVACRMPHASAVPNLRPYTTSTAKDAGWIWEIDLFSRRGTGYVYSSRHASAPEAEGVLLEHLGLSAANPEVKHLKMSIGHRKNMWSGNCLALGLAAGFLEPLESTGIYLVEIALSLFVDHVGGGEASPYFAKRFNGKMRQIYEELRDFLQIHYVLSDREDTAFWRDYNHDVKIPDSLQEKLDLWTFKLPSLTDLDGKLTMFGPWNYAYILAGMDHLPPGKGNLSPYISQAASLKAMSAIEQARVRVATHYPTHYDYVKKHRSVGRVSNVA
jgi:hypothetical protein